MRLFKLLFRATELQLGRLRVGIGVMRSLPGWISPAVTFSRPTISAHVMRASANSSGCSTRPVEVWVARPTYLFGVASFASRSVRIAFGVIPPAS